MLGTTNDAEWQRFARDLIGRPDLADDPGLLRTEGRLARRAEVDAAVAAWCAEHDLPTVQDAADRAGIGNARYNTATDVLAHPHLAARGRWAEVDTPGGPVPALRPPIDSTTWGPRMDAVPALGAHTVAVLEELGIPTTEIDALRAAGVIAG
ncbi:CoA transferase [Pseudonocardia sp. CA-107938]|uniref:CoA transferase n=1 Tax=Pseudonocardia sp. CA-107938 TaxID=3240021 RepID=UPI003D8F914A